jgi:dihydropteroate synthase
MTSGAPDPGALFVPLGRPRVMGVVNVTPDSFSDGGRWLEPRAAIGHGRQLLAEGADILDIGGESTRPGAEVAQAALDAGASVVNDVSGGLADPDILAVVAAAGAAYVAMHWRAHAQHMRDFAVYDGPGGVVAAVLDELGARAEAALAAGIAPGRLVLDPGLGFAKRAEHNWALLRDLDALAGLGHPLLVGTSRKSFLGRLLADRTGTPRAVDQREHANTALTVHCAQQRVWGVRVHDVRAARDALRVVERLNEEDR